MKPENDPNRIAVWAAIIVLLNVTHVWLSFQLSNPSPLIQQLAMGFYLVLPLGWALMFSDWFFTRKQEFKWQKWMWIFFVPWSFLWYFFEMEKPRIPDDIERGSDHKRGRYKK